jgi:hypothetical protein
MRYDRFMVCAVLLTTLLAEPHALSLALDSTGVNSTSLVRSQLKTIAEEVVDSANINLNERVAVFAEGEGPRTLAENACIEALQNRHCISVVIDTVSVRQILHLFVFGTEMKIREVNAKFSERTLRTTLEARVVQGADRRVRMLGTFYRETKDTAQVFASGVIPEVQKRDEGGIFQRMVTPFIVVGGAIVIVYLFFTVRS